MSSRYSTARAKLKAAGLEERIQKWKEHFKNLLGKSFKVTDEPITKIIRNQLNIKLGKFMPKEFGVVLRKIKNRKAEGLDKIPAKSMENKEIRYYDAVYNQNIIDRWTKGCVLLFSLKGDLGIAKNYWGIILTSIAAKIYNTLLLNRIGPEI